MMFSLFRNGTEVGNSEYFRIEADEELFNFIEVEIWARFIQRHLDVGGTLKGENRIAFIEEAKLMGYSIQPAKD